LLGWELREKHERIVWCYCWKHTVESVGNLSVQHTGEAEWQQHMGDEVVLGLEGGGPWQMSEEAGHSAKSQQGR
jgi:hypothetical protein